MNKILLLIMLMISTVATSQYKDDMTLLASTQTIDLQLDYQTKGTNTSYGYDRSGIPLGLGMVIGGASFIVAGLLTPSTYVGGSTTQKRPFMAQPKALPILSGALVMTIGCAISIGR